MLFYHTTLNLAKTQSVYISHFFFIEKCILVLSSGSVHCSQDLQISFFNKTFIKNGSHDTIHIFKKYFVTLFSIFSKISSIQMDPQSQTQTSLAEEVQQVSSSSSFKSMSLPSYLVSISCISSFFIQKNLKRNY